jgi:serine/threonine protein kinase
MKRIGKYEVIGEIGTGSMGTIYRARDQVLDRAVALKVLRAGSGLDPELKERFYREARACARLTHPNIITVYDLGEAEGTVYIAMELLSGSDLRKLFQENRPMDMALKVDLMAQVCDGLEHAHRQQLVHRDIKPSNIFYCDDQRAKILDFGIARLPLSSLTTVGKVLGSPNYMAPEQIRGAKCDSRSDVFSAGIVFYEFLAHAHPFQGEFIPRRIVGSPPDSLRERDPAIPEVLEALLLRSLEKDPEKRIQTAAELGAGLRAVLRRMRVVQTDPRAFPVAVSSPPEPASPSGAGAERRLSELLRIMDSFDEGIEKGNVAATRAALQQIGSLASVDDRFVVALSDCQARFNQMTTASQTTSPTPPPASNPTGEVVKPRTLPVPPPHTKTADPARKMRLTLMAVGVAVIVSIGMAALVRAPSHVDSRKEDKQHNLPVPAVATAIVAVPNADLMAAPSASGQRVASLRQGQVLDVTAIPGPGDRDYTSVRAGDGPVGFVRTVDLANWSGLNADAAFSILQLSAPHETAGPADLVMQLDKWNQFIANFPATPRLPEAYLESARLRLALVKLAKSEGKPSAEWQPNVDLAKEALSRVSADPALGAEAGELLQEVRRVSAPPAATTSTEQTLGSKVSSLWAAGKYREAMALVDKILAVTPDHKEALIWKNKIRKAQEAEAQ